MSEFTVCVRASTLRLGLDVKPVIWLLLLGYPRLFLGGVGTKTDFTNLQTILNSLRHAHAGLKLTWFS